MPLAAAASKPEAAKAKIDIMSFFGGGGKKKSEATAEPVDPNKEWKELRAGLKLQSIVNSKRINEVY